MVGKRKMVHLVWLWCECDVGVVWVSRGCGVDVVCVPCGSRVGVVWVSYVYCVCVV